jgi:hypothetical protein
MTLSTTLAVVLSQVPNKTLAAKLITLVEAEVREANERGYQTGFKDAKNEALIAIEKLTIREDDA